MIPSTEQRPTRPRPFAAARVLALAAAAALLAVPAAATTWIVELVNGNRFESRYQPEESSWDPTQVLLLTEQGNLIALDRAEIVRVSADVEDRGFGTVIDTKTVSLGILPNDADVPDPAGEQLSTAEVLQRFLDQQQSRPAPDYTVQQFVDPVEAGGGGLPVGFATSSTPPPQVTPVIIE